MKNLIARHVRYNIRQVCGIFDYFDIWDDVEDQVGKDDLDIFLEIASVDDEDLDDLPLVASIAWWITTVPMVLLYRFGCGLTAIRQKLGV